MLKFGFLGQAALLAGACGFLAGRGGCGSGKGNSLFDETVPISGSGGGTGASGDSSGGQCTTTKDCSDGRACVGGQCVVPCQSDKQCTATGLLCDTSIGYCSSTSSGGGGSSSSG